MKKILLLLLLCIGFNQTAKSQFVFQENWDGIGPGIASWTLYNQDGLTPNTGVSFVTGAWIATNEDFDNKVAMSTSWYTPAGTSNDWLVSPSITLPSGNNTLYFDAKAYDPAYLDSYKVLISTTNNAVTSFTPLFTQGDGVTPTSGENSTWTRRSIDLSAYAGQTIYIAFQNFSTDMFLLSIDNISVVNNNSCVGVTRDLFDSGNTLTSATINWTAIPGVTSYDISIGAVGHTPTATYNSTTNSFTTTGLTANSRYQYFVRNSCGSQWIGPFSFFTANNLPYAYGFDNALGYAVDGWSGSWSTGTVAANAQAGTQYLFSNSSTTAATNRSLYSRPINLQAGEQVTVSFYHREQSTTYNRSLKLEVFPDANPTAITSLFSNTALKLTTYTQATGSVYTAPTSGTYYFKLTDFSAITAAAQSMRVDSFNMTSVLGVDQFLSEKFALYPNPSKDVINVMNSINASITNLEITDLNGRIVKNVKLDGVSETQISVSDLSTGIYMMKIVSDKGTTTKKVIKE